MHRDRVYVVSGDPETLEPLSSPAYDCLRVAWSDVAPAIRSTRPPEALVFDARDVDRRRAGTLRRWGRRGLLPATAIHFPVPTSAQFARVAPLAAVGVTFLRDDLALEEQIQRLAGVSWLHRVGARLVADYRPDAETPRRCLQLLGEGGDALWVGIPDLAGRVLCSRTAFYTAFGDAGMPAPYDLQRLFRLTAATRLLACGEKLIRVARTVHYASARSLRNAYHALGITASEAREADGPLWLYEKWAGQGKRTDSRSV